MNFKGFMGVFIDSNGIYKLDGFNQEDLIRWNRLANDLDEIFDRVIKNYYL